MRVSVTYHVVTPASSEEGDSADNGWIHPKTERKVSIGGRCVRHDWYTKRVARAKNGEFDWSLREALDYLRNNAEGPIETRLHEAFVRTEGRVSLAAGLTLEARADGHEIVVGRNGYEYGDATTLELHISGVSAGTADRLYRLLRA